MTAKPASAPPADDQRHIQRAIRVLRRDYESPLADAVEALYKQSLAASAQVREVANVKTE